MPFRPRTAAAALAAALTLVAASVPLASARGPWESPLAIGEEGSQLTAFAVNEPGEAVVAWNSSVRTPDGYVDSSRLAFGSPDGTFSAPRLIKSGLRQTTGGWVDRVVLSDTGEAVAQSGYEVSIRRPGGEFGPFAPIAGGEGYPQLAIDRAGNAIALMIGGCEVDGVARSEILVAVKPAGASSFGSAHGLGCHRPLGQSVVAFARPGVPVILSEAFDLGGWDPAQRVYLMTGNLNGDFGPPAMLSAPGDDTDGYGRPLTLTSNGRGDVLAGWVSNRTGTSFALFRADGSIGRLNDAGGNFAIGTMDRDGDALAIPSTLDGHARPTLAPAGSEVFARLDVPDSFTPYSVGFDAFGTAQFAASFPDDPGRYVTWSLLPDGTFGDADYVVPVSYPRIQNALEVKFDARGHGWAAWTSRPRKGPSRPLLARYDGRYSAAVQPPSVSDVRVRRGKPAAASKASAARGVAIGFSLSKTARVRATVKPVELPARCRPKGARSTRACKRAAAAFVVAAALTPGKARLSVPTRLAKRLRKSARYRVTLRARDKRGRLSKPRTARFRG